MDHSVSERSACWIRSKYDLGAGNDAILLVSVSDNARAKHWRTLTPPTVSNRLLYEQREWNRWRKTNANEYVQNQTIISN